MSVTMEEIRTQFFIEANDILEKVGSDLLKAEVDYKNQDLLNSIFRGIHTIKGNAGTLGFIQLSEFGHHMENLLSRIRDGEIQLNSEIVDVILNSTDSLKNMLDKYEKNIEPEIDKYLCEKIDQLLIIKNDNILYEEIKIENSYQQIPTSIINTLIEHLNMGANIFRIIIKRDGENPQQLLKDIYKQSAYYYEDIANTPETLKQNQNFVAYIAVKDNKENIVKLIDDSCFLEITDLKTELSSKLFSLEKIDNNAIKEFVLSSSELFESVENLILAYEKNNSKESFNEIFRIVHTIKGDSNYIGFDDLSKYTHSLETLLYGLKNKTINRTARTTDLILNAIDGLKKVIFMLDAGLQFILIPEVFFDIENEIKNINNPIYEVIEETEKKAVSKTVVATFIEHMNQYKKNIIVNLKNPPLDKIKKDNIARILNSIKVSSEMMKFEKLHLLSENALTVLNKDNHSLLMEKVNLIFNYMDGFILGPKKIGELLIEEEKISEKDLSVALSLQKKIGEILLVTGKIDKKSLDSVLMKQEIMNEGWNSIPETTTEIKEIKTLRVDEKKVEHFSNLVGEIFVAKNTYQYILNQVYNDTHINTSLKKMLKDNLHSFSRLTDEIQLSVMSLRMVPLKGVFQKFIRVVRDISRKQGKQIELIMIGDETEIDKKVADILSEPLIHLVRNACDHGIEKADERLSAGKLEKGLITLEAIQEGRNIIIKINDDGKGMNRQKIYDKAVKMGIHVQSPQDENIFNVIFLPGFSTNDEITDISGRGVGMDVVYTTIKSLGGTVSCASREGSGSEITMVIPMAMGVSEALIVEADNKDYAIPFENVIEVIKIDPEEIIRLHDRKGIIYRNEALPVETLKKLLFNTIDDDIVKKEISIVILQNLNGKFGIIVDVLKNNMQISIKPAPEQLENIKVINGVSITGDGKVMLVLNPNELV